MNTLLPKIWLARGWLARMLWPVSLLYGVAISVRTLMYRTGILKTRRMCVPVVVVGNVLAGGAGKTPLVISLVQHLMRQGIRVGVVSRGYGRAAEDCMEVLADTDASSAGDEPLLIQRKTGAPVFVAPKRADAANALLKAHPQTQLLICDDGLQHQALERDLEIVVFDDRGTGNGWLLPAGPLREPWPQRARTGAHLVLHTGKVPAFAGFKSSRKLAAHAVDVNGASVPLNSLHGKKVAALAGIASPQAFFDMLGAEGLNAEPQIALPDHHDFSGYVIPVAEGSIVLCTEKDAVKLAGAPAVDGLTLLAVPLAFSPEPAFMTAFDALLAPLLSPLPSSHGH